MKYKKFDEVEREFTRLYSKQKYSEALEIVSNITELISEEEIKVNKYHIMVDKARCNLRCNLQDKALDILEELLDEGYMCPLFKFSVLNKSPRYKSLKYKNDFMRTVAEKETKFKYNVYVPEGYTKDRKYPLFISLHGDGGDVEYHNRYWKPEFFVKRGFIVVCPQSSQRIAYDSYIWNIRELYYQYEMEQCDFQVDYYKMYSSMRQDLSKCFDEITEQYAIDTSQVIIGGFSGGAHASIDMTLSNRIPIREAILLCSEKTVSFTEESAKLAAQKGVKWFFMDG